MIFTSFQLIALICFVFAIKVKMYKTNITGFVTITVVMLSVVLYYLIIDFFGKEIFEQIHYLLITGLLIFISIRSTYKKIINRSCNV